MATVATIIQNARYDLGDFGGQKYNDTMMLHYLNRIIPILDDVLISLDADYTKTSESLTLLTGSNTVALPTRCDNIIMVWYNSDLWLKESLDKLMYRYQINVATSNTGTPQYWSYNAANIYFNNIADIDYAITVYFHQRTATLTATDSMPYNDVFNEYVREAIVTMAQKAKDNKIPGVDQQFYATFKAIAERYVITRNTHFQNFHIDF